MRKIGSCLFLLAALGISLSVAVNSLASSDQEQIKTVCNDLIAAMRKGDMAAVKACTTGSSFTDLPAEALQVMGEKWLSVEKVDINGDKAVAAVGIKRVVDKKIQINLVKDGGMWLVKDYKPPW